MIHKAQRNPQRVVFPEGDHSKILRASQILVDEKIARPILLGSKHKINAIATELNLHLEGADVIDPADFARFDVYVEELYRLRQRHGITLVEARDLMRNNKNAFGAMMVHLGDADALVAGIAQHYPDTIRPALQIIKLREGIHRTSGLYILITKRNDIYFLADTTVNIEPTEADLVEIALCAAETARRFNIEPRVAMLSFSNFGSTKHPLTEKVRRATEMLKRVAPDLMVDGEMQADTAVVPQIIEDTYPFSTLKGGANVLVFPDLEAANIAYKLLMRIGGCETIGPILTGMRKPVHVLQHGCEVNDIVNLTAVAVVDAQEVASAAMADLLSAVQTRFGPTPAGLPR